MNLRQMVQESDTAPGRIFDIAVLVLIAISIISLSVETLPNLSPQFKHSLLIIEIIITMLFTIEYILRIITAPKKLRYIFSFYGIIDLIAIAPFYMLLGIDLYALRALRLLRIFRIIKLVRYSKTMERFGRALAEIREEAIIFFTATAVILYISAAGIHHFEHETQPEVFQSIFHSIWWAVATLTTVGYGDVYPVTAGGRAFTFVVLMCGLGIVAVPAGLISSALSKVRRDEED
ncbi:MAG: ion transporter [Alphaproteobacteria bacterium]|nr:ion transporter [Alphaproteobacteria bacterium]MCY4320202.1 ion transporter [Alphaproteobacteria bacterium]